MALSDNMRAAILMNVAMFAFTANDACMKLVTESLPLFQAIALRGGVTAAALLAIAVWQGAFTVRPVRGDLWRIGWRTLAEVLATLTFLSALMHMPLATLSAIMQSLPLAVTLAAAVVLREPVGWRRLTAIGIGFVGVMIIIRPGGEGFDRWSLVGLASVACVVLRDLTTRGLARTVPSSLVAVCAALAVATMGVAGSFVTGWQPVGLRELLLILGASVHLIVGYLTVVMVMRVGEIGFVAPFRYMALFWAILLGFGIFGTLPDAATLVGGAIVVATGLFTLWRERSRAAA